MKKPNDLTRQGVLNLNAPTIHWLHYLEKTAEGRSTHPCASCGGWGWFHSPGEMCPGCIRKRAAPMSIKVTAGRRHCDEYIDDESAPQCLRTFLTRARSPAHGLTSMEPYPRLYADHAELGRVRVVLASRFGDLGVTTQLRREIGYDIRCAVEELVNFSDKP